MDEDGPAPTAGLVSPPQDGVLLGPVRKTTQIRSTQIKVKMGE